MIYLDRRHPHFSPSMEVLCVLPREPLLMPLRLIVDDLGLDNQYMLQAILGQLRSGYHVRTRNMPRRQGRGVFIAHEGWERARCDGLEYFDDVYGEPF